MPLPPPTTAEALLLLLFFAAMPIRLRNTEAGTDGIGAALSDPGGGRNRLVGTDAGAAAAFLFAAPSLSEEA